MFLCWPEAIGGTPLSSYNKISFLSEVIRATRKNVDNRRLSEVHLSPATNKDIFDMELKEVNFCPATIDAIGGRYNYLFQRKTRILITGGYRSEVHLLPATNKNIVDHWLCGNHSRPSHLSCSIVSSLDFVLLQLQFSLSSYYFTLIQSLTFGNAVAMYCWNDKGIHN